MIRGGSSYNKVDYFQMKDTMHVSQIDSKVTYPYLLNIHYAKRIPSITYAFGLFDGDELIGVVTYGTPPSAPLRRGLAGDNHISDVLELNRLCLKYNRKNEASMLVGRSLKLLPKGKYVISFADTAQGHLGIVYQACNFIYLGLSAKRTDWVIEGLEHLHGQTIADKYRGIVNRVEAIRKDYGDKFKLVDRPRKHRYLYITGNSMTKKILLKDVKYKIEEYPK
jgi:hypothetical protein